MRLDANGSCCRGHILWAVLVIGMMSVAANGAVTVIGTQYQQDILYSEFDCIYDNANYPTTCPSVTPGANAHVYLKNDGASAVTVSDVTLASYSLATVIKEKVQGQNDAYSIYYYWDTPPSAIMNAGEPVWYRVDPNPIPAGGTAQAVIRLRSVPTTSTISIGVVHSEGTASATVTKATGLPRIASVGFSPDLDKVYIHWRRSGGAAPTTIKVDDVDVTSLCTTVSDANLSFAVTEYTPSSPLSFMSYHVYQGVYSDGKTATVSLRSWVNIFSYGTYGAGPTADWNDARAWLDTCADRGVNLLIYNLGSDGLASFLAKQEGQDYAAERDYSFAAINPSQFNCPDPRMWYLRDEPDAHDWHLGCNNNGLWLPCDKKHHTGNLAMAELKTYDAYRANHPNVQSMVNIDCTNGPYNYYTYGQLTDVGMTDPYYQSRQANAYWENPSDIPLWETAELYIYGTTKVHVAACEPNPVLVALSSTGDPVDLGDGFWPYAAPETKRTEAYYALAGGAKSMGYWWFLGETGLGTYTDEALALWKEIGLLGNEFRAAQPIIVTSHPVDMTLQGTTNVWARALASGTDTLMLVVVNNDHYNDIDGCHYNSLSNASVTATLPSWMTSPTPYAFEITAEGIYDVTTSLNGSNLTVTLGTVDLTRLIIITTNANLQSEIEQRYMDKCWKGVCTFASDHCYIPGFTQQPTSVSVAGGGTASFSVAALGVDLDYQWQKDGTNITNGGHFSGCTTATLTISGADSNDEASYRCMLSNAYYQDVASDAATLTVSCSSGGGFQNGGFETWPSGTVAPSWTGAYSDTTTNQFVRSTSIVRPGGSTLAQGVKAKDAANAWAHVYQAFDTSVGDAITVKAYAYPTAVQAGVNPQVGINSSSSRPSSWLYTLSTFTKNTWCTIGPLGFNATSPTTYLFLDVKRVGAVDTTTYWDDVAVYRAFVPTPPVVTNASSSTTLNVDVDPGCNLNNSNAQYAITIGGGAFTLGTNWVQSNGSVSTSEVWQTEATWGTKTVTGLTSNTTYTFKVKARYNGTYTQATDLGTGAQGTPHTIIVITQQPAIQNVCPGTNPSFSVAATGEGTLYYQWQKNQVDITNGGHYSGCTSATLTVTGADGNDAASYRCRVTDVGGSVNSQDASLMLKAATAFTTHPAAQDVCAGEYTELYVVTSGEGTLTYQWQKNQTNVSDGGHLSGCTTNTLAFTGIDTSDAGNYRCVVTGGCGSATSNEAAITLKDATTIIQQPTAQDVCPGANGQFNVVATGEGTVTYQWQRNSVDITNGGHYSGCTTATLTVSGADSNDAANYRCVVSAECGDPVNSNQAALTLKAVTTITQQPSAQNVCPGSNAQFTISGTGAGTLTYQWQKNQANLSNGGHYSGCTTATLTVTGADIGDAASYRCVVNGTCGSATSNQAALTLKAATTITQQPSAQNLCPGANAQFTVAGTGDGTLAYQWQKNQANLSNGGHYSGCTTATLAVTGVDGNDAASYRCIVTGGCSSATSNQVALTIKAATAITQQPSAQNLCPGANAQFTVAGTGDGTLTYQWQKNQANLTNGGHFSGCTTATLTITGTDSSDEANYRCVVTAGCGSATSNEAGLTLKAATSITQQPSAQSVCLGSNAQFTIAASGDGTPTYQWQKNSVNVTNGGHYSGCTTATLTVTGADANDAANYRCVVTGGCGNATSDQAALTLGAATTITQHPSAQNSCSGANAQFTVAATGDGTLTYQWQKNSVNLTDGGHFYGCATATLTITGTDSGDVANYRCVVTGGCGSANSNQAALTVGAGTTITLQPSNQFVESGGTAVFNVTATGDGTLTYQWQKDQYNLSNGGHYSGCTTATLTISSVDANDEANYRCVVTGGCGSANSDEAALTVYTCPSGLQNGNFEYWPSGTIAPNWTGAYSATVSNQFVRSTSIVRPGGSTISQGVKARDAANAWAHVYQGIETTVGDALTIIAYAYPTAVQSGVNPQVGVNTSTARPSTWLYTLSTFTRYTWCTIGPLAFNATGTTTYLFLDVKRVGAVDTTTYWDDVAVYQAHVPQPPTITSPSSTSLSVNVNPGCNSTNSSAQFAITIGGGAYTLGTHWVQADGTVSTTAAWQTDAAWGSKTVGSLTTGTTYTFQVMARYSGTYTQTTDLGTGAAGTP